MANEVCSWDYGFMCCSQIFGFQSISESITDICLEASWGGRLPYGGSW